MDERAWIRSDVLSAARNAARKCRYALAVHGSQVRDLDLIAVPWEETAIGAYDVAESIASALGGLLDDEPERRPYGRLAWAIRPASDQIKPSDWWYVDLSVTPRAPAPKDGETENG